MQQAIVAEIEAEQALVASNRELISRLEKKIQDPRPHLGGSGESWLNPFYRCDIHASQRQSPCMMWTVGFQTWR